MKDKEIIESFFSEGCVSKEGKKLPLRNCLKIKSLFDKDLDSASCCESLQREVFETYKQRMEIFLEMERLRLKETPQESDRACSNLKKNC
jgi:hypothetical protein